MTFFRQVMLLLLCVAWFMPGIVLARLPNDPNAEQWAYKDIGAYEVWDKTVGSQNVIVAIIDNGFDTFHPDLFSNAWKNEDEVPDNNIDDDNNGYVDDVWGWNFAVEDRNNDGVISNEEREGNNDPRPPVDFVTQEEQESLAVHHGTLVAGIVGAVGNNNSFGTGLNWRVKLMNIKVLGNKGSGELSRLGEAIRYAVDNGADVINFSVVGSSFTKDMREGILYASSKGVAMVAAAGNNLQFLNDTPFYPVCADKALDKSMNRILGVSAIDENHTIAVFSNTGSDCVDITAPGVNISGTMRFSPGAGLHKQYGGGWKGTSFSAPMVSATLALLKAIQPRWKAPELYQAVLSTVHKTPPQDESTYANLFGRGLLQSHKALMYALERRVGAQSSRILGFLQPHDGVIHIHNQNAAETQSQLRDIATNAIQILPFETNNQRGYVMLKRKDTTMVELSILDHSWNFLSLWNTNFAGDMALAVGDVHASAGIEVVLGSDKENVLKIFSLDGSVLSTVNLGKHGTPISLTTIENADNGDDIAAVFLFNETLTLHRYTQSGRLVNLIPLRNISKKSIIRAADVTGDGIQEYVLTGDQGEQPVLMYLKQDGTIIQAVFAYDPGFTSGVQLEVFDYDKDGAQNAIVRPRDGSDRIRVWDGVKIIDQSTIGLGDRGVLFGIHDSSS